MLINNEEVVYKVITRVLAVICCMSNVVVRLRIVIDQMPNQDNPNSVWGFPIALRYLLVLCLVPCSTIRV